ncbi:diacylglycerol kinase [Streptomyces tanashiensis]|uniref:Diacylglycerol kinase n=1 Tax=Streptomyces tanashiensis TaxID=67367 RepID=A0ABY6QZF6_9ACTN|nr:diacylglycerol kinase [Streptomyces tanashiensis]UZX23135.1 diacylglycerol kinase [Streptomyces tanashiensis]GGS93126.1 diacylglycerol kinase [Streptomyces tanashiensis]GGY30685.1 diacylglycerol kinase [Streptomyces tanashiensis]
MSDHDQLLVIVDPVARRSDGESVRIAKDVLSAGAEAKICLPDGPEEFSRALARRGSRRPVVLGDDRALLRTVALLHRERELAEGALSLVPIGAPDDLEVAHALGVPRSTPAAARVVLHGAVRRLDLLVDDSDGVVLGDLLVPGTPALAATAPSVWGTCRSLVRTLVRPAPAALAVRTHRLRVEADGVLLADVDAPVEGLTVRPVAGRAEVTVHPVTASPRRATARTVTVSGPDFRYRADGRVTGPVRRRTWTIRAGAWGLTLPRDAA